MLNDILLNILFNTKQELEKTLNLTDEEIEKEALAYFKRNKKRLISTFLDNKLDTKRVYLSIGASGAGKSEFITSLNKEESLNIIDTDEIIKLFPYYSGQNTDLFQKVSIKTVEYLIDNSFKKNLSFILNTDIVNFNVANKNIIRALNRDYKVEIFYIFREYQNCKDMIKKREEKDGKTVNNVVFDENAIGSLDTFTQLFQEYRDNKNINLTIIDLENDTIFLKREPLKMETILKSYRTQLDDYLKKIEL